MGTILGHINNYTFRPIFRGIIYIKEFFIPPNKQDHDHQHDMRVDTPVKVPQYSSSDEENADLNMTGEDKQLFDQQCFVIQGIRAKTEMRQADLDEMAFAYTQLAFLHSKYDSKDYEKCLKLASSIYDSSPHKYYEDKITLLNNVAINLDSNKKYAQAAGLFEQTLQLANIYLPYADQRTIIIKNNLACAYMNNDRQNEARGILHSCSQATNIRKDYTNPEVQGLIHNNINFYGKEKISAEGQQKAATQLQVA